MSRQANIQSKDRRKDRRKERGKESGQYYQAYGCERDPFSDQGISGLFFSGGEREKIVQQLLHFSRFSQSPLMLVGKIGAGKTTVLQQLPNRVDKDIDIALVEAGIMQSDRQLLESICRGFRQPVPEQADLFENFSQWVAGQGARQRYVILCFDSADNLTAEFLRPFFDLVAMPGSFFRLVLAGEQELKPILQALADQYEFSLNVIELPLYNEQNVRDYAAYRLQSAGYQGELPFTDIQLRAGQRRSNGNIGQLNSLLRDMLIAGSGYHKKFNFKFPLVNLGIVAGLLLVILIAVLSNDSQPPELGEEEEIQLILSPPHDSSIDAPGVDQQLSGDNSSDASGLSAKTGEPQADIDERSEVLADKPANVVLAAEKTTQAAEPGLQRDASDTNNAEQVASRTPQKTEELVEKASKDPASANASNIANDATSDATSAGQTRQQLVRERLRSWPETGYALQVFGTHNTQRARKLVEQYFGQVDLLFYETLHNGKPWFVVISGPYSGRQAAQKSIALLPESLQRLRPWPRNIASIRNDIERYQAIIHSGE